MTVSTFVVSFSFFFLSPLPLLVPFFFLLASLPFRESFRSFEFRSAGAARVRVGVEMAEVAGTPRTVPEVCGALGGRSDNVFVVVDSEATGVE